MKGWTMAALAAVAMAGTANGQACDSERFGAGVDLPETTALAEVLDRAVELEGRAVAVEGTVREVCEMAGCWLEIVAAEGDRSLRVKVKDGEIVFPLWARGHAARAQGTVERLEYDRSQYVRYLAHQAEEQGGAFDPDSVEGDGPYHVVRLQGTGAEICR